MPAIFITALVTCVASLFLGQAALRLCGVRQWSWVAPAVGISLAMLISLVAIHVPGRCTSVAVLLGALTLAAVVWCVRDPAHRPPLAGLLAAAPVAALSVVPYLAVGRGGIQGVGLDNDMTTHLLWAEAILSAKIAAVSPLPKDYPLGPHAMVAVLAKALGVRIDESFSGWAMALPVINAWTALALVRRSRWLGKLVVATVVGMPFLVAAYYGQGAFKEVLLAGLLLALIAYLSEEQPVAGRFRWVPVALLLGGVLSIYSVAGLPWPLAIIGAWVLILAVGLVSRSGFGALWPEARRQLPAVAIAAAALAVLLVPQIPRLVHFVTLRAGTNGTGIEKTELGNLAGPLPGWEAFGVWNNPDFRLPASPAFSGGMWTAFVLGLVLLGAIWAIRRGRWTLLLAAALSMLIWKATAHSQSPYVAAKALVIASPLLLALAALPLVERKGIRSPWPFLPPLLALVLFVAVGRSDLRALRFSPVGPTDHASELISLRETIDGQPTLWIGDDDFVQWELAGIPLSGPVMLAAESLPIPPQKHWEMGQPLDFDSVRAAAFNANRWVVASRDAAASTPPPQLHLVRRTENYSLWRRVGKVAERARLDEGEMPGALLRCDTPSGRAVAARAGVASVRARPVSFEAPGVAPGTSAVLELPLGPGSWALGAEYASPLPVQVRGGGLNRTLDPTLDRVGARWPLGIVRVRPGESAHLIFHVEDNSFTPGTDPAFLGRVTASPLGRPEQIIALRRACGQYVDWYRYSGNKNPFEMTAARMRPNDAARYDPDSVSRVALLRGNRAVTVSLGHRPPRTRAHFERGSK